MNHDNHVRNYVIKQSETKRCGLEPNHTHFLLFDGKSSNTDAVLLQRAKIEKYSRHVDIKSTNEEALIPIVMILLEGGPFSVRTVCHGLQSNTPLVVVKVSSATQINKLFQIFNRDLVELQILYLICMPTILIWIVRIIEQNKNLKQNILRIKIIIDRLSGKRTN